jgi:sporulation protein YlmC with PRC-barrel domain
MASRRDVSFYRDLLHKPVVDCDGLPIGALLDLSTDPLNPTPGHSCVRKLVVRPRRFGRQITANGNGNPLVVPWELVASLEPRSIRLRQTSQDLDPATLDGNEVLLHKHILDQQIVDCRGSKLHRVNDITMALSDGTLCLWGMDTGIRGFLTRLGFDWGLLTLLRPLYERLHHHVIRWECVDRVEPARGWIRLRVSRDEIRSAGRQALQPPDA